MAESCASCGTAMVGGGMMSSKGEVCDVCFETVEPSSLPVGAAAIVSATCAALPYFVAVWSNGLGIVHIGAGAVGAAAGGIALAQGLKVTPSNMVNAGVGGASAAMCAFHLLRGLGIV